MDEHPPQNANLARRPFVYFLLFQLMLWAGIYLLDQSGGILGIGLFVLIFLLQAVIAIASLVALIAWFYHQPSRLLTKIIEIASLVLACATATFFVIACCLEPLEI